MFELKLSGIQITFVNSQHEDTNSKSEFELKNRIETFT